MTIAPCDLIEPSDFSVFVVLMDSSFLELLDTFLSSLKKTVHTYNYVYRNLTSSIWLMCNKIAFTFLGNLYQQQNNGIRCWFQGKLDLLQKGAFLSVRKYTIYLLNWNIKFTNIYIFLRLCTAPLDNPFETYPHIDNGSGRLFPQVVHNDLLNVFYIYIYIWFLT